MYIQRVVSDQNECQAVLGMVFSSKDVMLNIPQMYHTVSYRMIYQLWGKGTPNILKDTPSIPY